VYFNNGSANVIGGNVIYQDLDTTGYFGLGHAQSSNHTVTVGTTIPLSPWISLALGGNIFHQTTNDYTDYTDQLAPGVSSPTTLGTYCDGSAPTIRCSTSTQASTNSATYGWFLEPHLNVRSRFFAAPGFRLDGGSGGTHATNSSGGTVGGLSAFPKIDFSYIAVDRESRRPLWGVLTLLRPRLAFGFGGTQPPPEERLRLFNETTYPDYCGATFRLDSADVYGICLSTLGNTQLRPERSRELEGGFDATLWNGRFVMMLTKYDKIKHDAIITVPVAPSVSGNEGASFNIAQNIGDVRNTGTEITVNATMLESRALSWNIGANVSNNNNVLVHLTSGQSINYGLGLVPGYPLFGKWVAPIESFSDLNHDGKIEPNEVVLGDSLVYAGQPNPKYQFNLNTTITLLNGQLSATANFAYQNGMTQTNAAALYTGSFYLLGNNPATPLAYQAAVQAAECFSFVGGYTCATKTNYGLLQTVNEFRFTALSINYQLPRTVSSWFHVPRASVALQGSNLALHTNYRGKDPNVNAFSTVSSGDETADTGQVPEPRTWWLKFTLGN
jgi:hypothetical protein